MSRARFPKKMERKLAPKEEEEKKKKKRKRKRKKGALVFFLEIADQG